MTWAPSFTCTVIPISVGTCVYNMVFMFDSDGQAIWMDENIRFGKTDRCSTFNNPPLCPSGDFEIRVLEVYGFSGA